MNDARDAVIGLIVGAILVVVFLLFGQTGAPLESMICPHPVYAAGSTQLLSCDGHVTLVTPTPAAVKR